MQEIPTKIVLLLLLIFSLTISLSTQNPEEQESYYCGKTKIREPFVLNQSSITCRSGKLYFKTSIGLFHVSSIDYTTKTLILGTEKVRSGARVSMEVEGHLPDLCSACERPDGNCGVARRCLCHPKECKNKVVNFGTKSRALSGNTHLVLLFSTALFLIL